MKGQAPVVLFLGAAGGLLVLLAAAGGGSPVAGAQRVGGPYGPSLRSGFRPPPLALRVVQGQIGRFLSWAELTASTAASRLGLDNTPTPEAQRAMQLLVANVLDPLRQALGRPVQITSGYRAPLVNRAVSGSSMTSTRYPL